MRRILLAFLCVFLIAPLSIGLTLLAGWRAELKEIATIRNGDLLKFWSEDQVDTDGMPVKTFAPVLRAAERLSDSKVPVNPYTGKQCAEYHRGSEQYLGGFSYLLVLDHWGYLTDSAIVVYSPMPTVSQRRYCQLSMRPQYIAGRPYFKYGPDLRRPGPEVDWIGGECGNHYEYLARGMAPADAVAELNRMYKAADPYDTADLRGELVFLTPEQYAAKQNSAPAQGASTLQ